jgi:predicted ABC-type ATPase
MARIRRKPRCIIIAGPNGAGKTTFARDYLPGIARLIHFVNADLIAGGIFEIVYIRLASPQLALSRIASRVRQGGHDVARTDVIRRFKRGWSNFLNVYQPLADHWAIYENSESKPRLLERGP